MEGFSFYSYLQIPQKLCSVAKESAIHFDFVADPVISTIRQFLSGKVDHTFTSWRIKWITAEEWNRRIKDGLKFELRRALKIRRYCLFSANQIFAWSNRFYLQSKRPGNSEEFSLNVGLRYDSELVPIQILELVPNRICWLDARLHSRQLNLPLNICAVCSTCHSVKTSVSNQTATHQTIRFWSLKCLVIDAKLLHGSEMFVVIADRFLCDEYLRV